MCVVQVLSVDAVEDLGAFTDPPLESAAHAITARHHCLEGGGLLSISEAAWSGRVRVVEESVGSMVYLCCDGSPLHSLVHRRRVWSVLLNGGMVGLSSSATESQQAVLSDCQLLRPTMVAAGPGFWLRLYREHVSALRRAVVEEDVIAGLETDRQCAQEAEAKVLRALGRRLGGHVQVVEVGGDGPGVSDVVVDFLQRALGGCEVRGLFETDQCGPIADRLGVAVGQVLLHSLEVDTWQALEPPSPMRTDWSSLTLTQSTTTEAGAAVAGRLCVSSPFLCEGSGERLFYDEKGRCFAVTDQAAAVPHQGSSMVRLGPIDRTHRLGGQQPGGGVIASASRSEAVLGVSKYVEALRVRGEAGWGETLVGYVVPSELLRQAGEAVMTRKLHVDLHRLGTAAKLRPQEIPSILVRPAALMPATCHPACTLTSPLPVGGLQLLCDAASLPPPVGPLPPALQSQLRDAVAAVSISERSPLFSSLPELCSLAASGASPMALLARLLSCCLGSATATQPGDLMRCILSHAHADMGDLDDGPPSLTELGLDCTSARLLALCFARVFHVCLPVGLLLLPSTTPLSLLAAIRRHARRTACCKDPEQLLSLSRLPAEFRRTLLLALRETALPSALRSPRSATTPTQVLNVAPFPQLHEMHHDRLQQASALSGLHTRHVLLLGGAGFLGQHLLRALLAHDRCTVVHCLVRARAQDQAAHRLKGNWGPRLQVLVGDASQPCLGLGPTAFCRLAGLVDSIYVSIYGETVAAARNLLLFACTHHRKAVHYVSCLGAITEDLFSKEGWAVPEVSHSGLGLKDTGRGKNEHDSI